MNFSTLLGFIAAAAIIYFGALHPASNPMIFFDPHALILVFGGTLTAAIISFPIKKLIGMGKLFFKVVFLNAQVKNADIVKSLIDAAYITRNNPTMLGSAGSPHPFSREGFQLVAEGVLNESDLNEVLVQRSEFFKAAYANDAKIFAALGKFPPAFGLLGAVTGMIAMMMKLGTSGPEVIGAAMGIALVATFWGIAVANLFVLPLAEFYKKLSHDDVVQRNLIVEGIMMLKRRESPVVVHEKLNSFLPINERLAGQGIGSMPSKAA